MNRSYQIHTSVTDNTTALQMCNVLSAESAGPHLMSLHAARTPSIYSKRTAGELVVDGKTLSALGYIVLHGSKPGIWPCLLI